MSGHVGDRLSALVDGELDHDERDQLLAHVTCCPSCKEELEGERRVHALVGALGEEGRAPAPSGDMIASLLRLDEDAGPDGFDSDAAQGAQAPPRTHGHAQLGAASLPTAGRRPGGGFRPTVGASTRPARLGRPGFGRPGFGRSSIGRSGGPARLQPSGKSSSELAATGPTTGAPLLQRPSRLALGVAGAASAFGMSAALAFTLNGAPETAPQVNVTPPAQEMGVEDAKIIPEYPAPDSGAVSEIMKSPEPTGNGSGSVSPTPVRDEGR